MSDEEDLVEEITRAVDLLTRPSSLCYVSLGESNGRVLLDLSFRPATVESSRGTLEVALKWAKLFIVATDVKTRLSWNPEVLALRDKLQSQPFTVTTRPVEASPEHRPLARVKIGPSQKSDETQRNSAFSTRSELVETVYSDTHKRFLVSNGSDTFRMDFFAHPDANLIFMNPEFHHIAVLDIEQPHDFLLSQLKVNLSMKYEEDLEEPTQALSVMEASGIWRELKDSGAKRLISEILLSRLIAPAHKSRCVWSQNEKN